MATQSVTSPENPATELAAVEFYWFNGAYTVAAGTTPTNLLDDARCWIMSAAGVASALSDNAAANHDMQEAEAAWGIVHLLKMAMGAIDAAARREVQP